MANEPGEATNDLRAEIDKLRALVQSIGAAAATMLFSHSLRITALERERDQTELPE